MILADTSVWIDHFRFSDPALILMLHQASVAMHPWIVGELACGNLKNRNTTLIDLQELPEAAIASQGEVLAFIEKHKLMGQGIGYMDVNLLVSAALDSLELWTNDRRLYRLARTVGVQAKLNRSQQ